MVNSVKTALRSRMKVVRSQLSSDLRAAQAQTLADLAERLPVPSKSIVSGYLPINDELDPRPLLIKIMTGGAQLCLPVVQGRTQPLIFRAWSPDDTMDTAAWGIQEPKAEQPTLWPDLMLVPLLAVDRAGNRLGYGAGHYDRSIAEIRSQKPVITVGLAFDAQIIDAVPHMPYDVALDWILTPSGLVQCRDAG